MHRRFSQRIRIRSYPVREYLGLVFAFLGDAEPPEFPRYPEFEHFDGMLEIYFATSDELKAAFGSPVIGMLRKDEETLVQLDAPEIRIVAEEHVL